MAESIATLVHHRFLALPDGTRLIGTVNFELLKQKTGLNEQELNKRFFFERKKCINLNSIGMCSG
jgi:hypothetical protein